MKIVSLRIAAIAVALAVAAPAAATNGMRMIGLPDLAAAALALGLTILVSLPSAALASDVRVQAAWPVIADALNQVELWKLEPNDKKPSKPPKGDASSTALARFFRDTVNDETVPDGIPPAVLKHVVVLPWNDAEACVKILEKQGHDIAALIECETRQVTTSACALKGTASPPPIAAVLLLPTTYQALSASIQLPGAGVSQVPCAMSLTQNPAISLSLGRSWST